MAEIAWFIDHIDDVRSDFSVYHRVDEIDSMTADRFLAYLRRLPVYGGAVAFLIQQEQQRAAQPQQSVSQPQTQDVAELMRTDPLFMGMGTAVTVPAS
ncbi:hypothetical protein [Amycolatopsis sp. NBC_01480]|uniref:hypothetical protein n=1 Tax=Amycolatopsis sp. NBC_01480 TaxID=2903562 RepID=UPI002E2C235C|nr:hypothetical protein [Amycolatopsis sp. NBC_01480]